MQKPLGLAVIIFLSVLIVPMHGQSQIAGAAVSLECEEATITPVDPLAGGNVTFECTVSNPTSYVEKVSISITSDGIATDGPGDLYIGAESNETFSVNASWSNSGDLLSGYSVNISVTVQELNNLPPPNTASDQTNVWIDIDGAYALHGCSTQGTTTANVFDIVVESHGTITVELNYSEAPMHAENFALLALMGCMDNTTFHRVVDNFMIQGGDFENHDGTGGHAGKWFGYCNAVASTDSSCNGEHELAWTVPLEVGNLTHVPYVLSAARASNQNSAGSQFFIVDDQSQSHLDGSYSVFGRVIAGFSVVQSISQVDTNGETPAENVLVGQVLLSTTHSDDNDNDDVPNQDDNCESISNTDQLDTDGDGVGDACDEDDDGDGVPDSNDAFPLDENESSDTDGDGVGNQADHDDDNDGMNDTDDDFPLNAEETTDTDGDGIGDNADSDDDGDGVADSNDNCQFVSNPAQEDDDGDGVGSECDGDEIGIDDISDSVPTLGFVATLVSMVAAFVAVFRRD